MVIDEATNQFAPLFYDNPKKLSQLKKCCSSIDLLIQKYNCISCDVEVDSISLEIKITLTFPTKNNFIFPTNLTYHSQISCYPGKDNSINLKFLFPGIWSKISPMEVLECLL